MQQGKRWWKSRVIWLNALAGAFAFASAYVQRLESILSVPLVLAIGAAVCAINVGLRFITSDPITSKQMDDRADPQ
jgi:hypothetical protein